MKEEIFLELGFEKTVVTAEESGAPTDWHYYTLDIGDLCLITSSSDEIKDDIGIVISLNQINSK